MYCYYKESGGNLFEHKRVRDKIAIIALQPLIPSFDILFKFPFKKSIFNNLQLHENFFLQFFELFIFLEYTEKNTCPD